VQKAPSKEDAFCKVLFFGLYAEGVLDPPLDFCFLKRYQTIPSTTIATMIQRMAFTIGLIFFKRLRVSIDLYPAFYSAGLISPKLFAGFPVRQFHFTGLCYYNIIPLSQKLGQVENSKNNL
jgi:hypothetical protein